MNQLDVSGPPPAAKEQLDALPIKAITQEQVGELQSTSSDDKVAIVSSQVYKLQSSSGSLPSSQVQLSDVSTPLVVGLLLSASYIL